LGRSRGGQLEKADGNKVIKEKLLDDAACSLHDEPLAGPAIAFATTVVLLDSGTTTVPIPLLVEYVNPAKCVAGFELVH
jgi:hypothetical protein